MYVLIHGKEMKPTDVTLIVLSYPRMTVSVCIILIKECYVKSVKGHIEKDSIVVNFTGKGIDSLYVSVEFDEQAKIEDRVKYYAKSNNLALPTIELYGCLGLQP